MKNVYQIFLSFIRTQLLKIDINDIRRHQYHWSIILLICYTLFYSNIVSTEKSQKIYMLQTILEFINN